MIMLAGLPDVAALFRGSAAAAAPPRTPTWTDWLSGTVPPPPPPPLLFFALSDMHLMMAMLGIFIALFWSWLRAQRAPPQQLEKKPVPIAPKAVDNTLTVFYASQKGHGKRFAERLVARARDRGIEAVANDVAGFDTDTLTEYSCACFIVATYAGGSAVPGTEAFFHELAEMSRDFRIERTLLSNLSYAVFGCGNSEYPARDFNACARRLDRALKMLGAKRLLARCEGDDIDNALSEQFDRWMESSLLPACAKLAQQRGGGAAGADAEGQQPKGRTPAQARRFEQKRKQGELDAAKAEAGAAERAAAAKTAAANGSASNAGSANGGTSDECCGGNGDGGECCRDGAARDANADGECCGGGKERSEEPAVPSGDGVAVPLPFESDDEASEHGSDGGYGSDGGELVDVEDLGSKMLKRDGAATAKVGSSGVVGKSGGAEVEEAEKKEMVTPSLRTALTKQGYKIVGSHSGVKLCRWTKAMLRGRGGCCAHATGGRARVLLPVRYMPAAARCPPAHLPITPIAFCRQAFVLRDRLLPVHGGHALARLRQQMRLLLAPPRQPSRHVLPLAGRQPAAAHRRLRGGAQGDGQADEGRARREARAIRRGVQDRPPLRTLARR